MNRIYQGRVVKVELPIEKGQIAKPVDLDFLWHHHQLFQDAVNYYLMAIAAMASDEESPAGKLRKRMEDAWRPDPAHWAGRKFDGLCRSLMRIDCPGISEQSSIEDGFKAVLAGNPAKPEVLQLAVDLLLSKVSGDAAIQQGGRAYWPRFCNPKARPTWDYSAANLQSRSGKDKLAASVHQELNDDQRIKLADALQLSWTVKLQPDSCFNAEESKQRLEEAVDYFIKSLASADKRLAQFLDKYPDALKRLKKLREDAKALEGLAIPRNRKAALSLTFSTLLFKYFPSAMTQALLALHVAKPKKAEAEMEEDRFVTLGDDPIKLARGERGYVFPAFTSLPIWEASDPADIKWSEFDIAAFKEALKTVNQFRLKTDERTQKREKYANAIAYLDGKTEKWDDPESSESEDVPGRLNENPRRKIVSKLLKELWIENAMTEGEEYAENPGAIGPRALRGWGEITEKWNRMVAPGEAFSPAVAEKLQDHIGKYQAANPKEMGHVYLFQTLTKEPYWSLWQRPTLEERSERKEKDWSDHILKDYHLFLECREEVNRLSELIRFTPADAKESRRLFMFSDLNGRSKHKHLANHPGSGDQRRQVEVSLAVKESDVWTERRACLDYVAPRLLRDRLRQVDGEEDLTSAAWEQPMMAALGWSENGSQNISDCAVSLMPDEDRAKKIRFLLNFPVALESPMSEEQKVRATRWKNQFNGKDGSHIHLHWPATMDKKYHERGWWKQSTPFSFLAADLGTRACASWAQFEASPGEALENEHFIGEAEGKKWKAKMKFQGQFRLPGEDALILEKGQWKQEPYGSKGRKADKEETEAAGKLARELGFTAQDIPWDNPELRFFPTQNYHLLRAFRATQGRLARYHRWLRFLGDEKKRDSVFEELTDLQKEAEMNPRVAPPAEWKTWITDKAAVLLGGDLKQKILALQETLKNAVEPLANRICPLRGRRWEWVPRDDKKNWILQQTVRGTAPEDIKIRGQRGLSLERIEQLESLRQRLQSLNRALQRTPGDKVAMGRRSRGKELPDPCPDLLLKLDAMKEQRVNQTAHLILAQALGVRLKAHQVDGKERHARDLHGEYEVIPGRKPVDFIVLEDLSRYRTSLDRGPSENSRLMKWCHRAVTNKLIELCEPYGIPVLETPPAYTSLFCSRTGFAGFRAREYTLQRWKTHGKFAKIDDKIRPEYEEFFETLVGQIKGKPLTLLVPDKGGPRFVAYNRSDNREISQDADINAAINLGLRAVAAPDNLRILNRLRCIPQEKTLVYQQKTKREKARFSNAPKLTLSSEPADDGDRTEAEESARIINVFVDVGRIANFDKIQGLEEPAATGKGLWATIKKGKAAHCLKLNQARIQKWRGAGLLPSDDDLAR